MAVVAEGVDGSQAGEELHKHDAQPEDEHQVGMPLIMPTCSPASMKDMDVRGHNTGRSACR